MNWTLRNRLLVGCATLVAVTTIACLIGWRQATVSQRGVGELVAMSNENAALIATAEQIQLQFSEARRHQLEFLAEKDPATATAAAQALDQVARELAKLEASETLRSLATTTAAAVQAERRFGANFKQLEELATRRGLTPTLGLEGEMRTATHAVEGSVGALNQPELQVLLLMCRRHEKDYLLRRDPKYLSEVDQRLQEFEQKAAALGLGDTIRADCRAKWATYRQALAGIVDTDAQIAARRAENEKYTEEFGGALAALRNALIAHTAEEQQQTVAAMSSSSNLLLVVLVAGLALGAGVAFLLTRAITAPIARASATLRGSAEETTGAAAQVSTASQNLAEGSSEQAAALEETSASLEEISSMARHSADSAAKAKDLAAATRNAAEAGASEMAEMKRAMDGIKESSANIAKIVKSIDEIAFQTNILALNAAVEAARAGEAGAGFAVVAEEVRNLAQRSAQAARDTTERIEDSITRSEAGVRISERVADSFSQIVGKARNVDELVGEIATASREQTQGIGQVTTAVAQMDKITQANAANAEESASAAEELNAQAEMLREAVIGLDTFIGLDTAPRETARPAAHFESPPPAPTGRAATAPLTRAHR